MLVHGRRNNHIGYSPQTGHVKSTMMRGSVFSYKSRTVKTQYHIQLSDGHIMNDIVKRTLCKG